MILNGHRPAGAQISACAGRSISPARSSASDSPDFKPGDPVILTGWRVGEVQWGGYAEKARVKAAQLVRLPAGHRA